MRRHARNVRRVGAVRMHACNHACMCWVGVCVSVCQRAKQRLHWTNESQTAILDCQLHMWTPRTATATHPKAGTLHVAAVNAGREERGKDGFRLPRSPFCVTCTRPHTTKFAPTRNTTQRQSSTQNMHAATCLHACRHVQLASGAH
jgi:hypothetical protein